MDETTNSGSGLITDILTWASHPFASQGSALNWVLFVGLLVIAAWFWNHVLLQITKEV
jgi:hypothetical protein